MVTFTPNAQAKRIDWFYRQFGGPASADVRDFVRQVNGVYYKHFTSEYHRRFVEDIEGNLRAICQCPEFAGCGERTFINIGGGTGFEYAQLAANGVGWKEYVFIEPDKEMAGKFVERFSSSVPKPRVIVGDLSGAVRDLQGINNKTFIICSCLHHIVWLEEFLKELDASARPGDCIAFVHEPNNEYCGSAFMWLGYLLRALTTTFLLRKVGVFKTEKNKEDQQRWAVVRTELQQQGITRIPMPVLAIRRTIDYWVGAKGDWKLLGIPAASNEGFWTGEDIKSLLGRNYEVVYESSYRHLGDPSESWACAVGDKFLSQARPRSGSVFNLLLRKS